MHCIYVKITVINFHFPLTTGNLLISEKLSASEEIGGSVNLVISFSNANLNSSDVI